MPRLDLPAFDLSRLGEATTHEHEECAVCGEHMLDCECDEDD